MKEIRDGFHEVLRNLHRLTISSSALLRISDKQGYKAFPNKENMEKALEAVKKSCDLAKISADEVEKLRDIVYKKINISKKEEKG